jgi:hypothetical protein
MAWTRVREARNPAKKKAIGTKKLTRYRQLFTGWKAPRPQNCSVGTCSVDRQCSIDMPFTNTHLLLSMNEVREPPVDCMYLLRATSPPRPSFLAEENRGCRVACVFETDMSGTDFVNALALAPCPLADFAFCLPTGQFSFICLVNREPHQNSMPGMLKGMQVA